MRRIAGLMIVIMALLLSQARGDPLDFGPSRTEAQLSQGEHPPVLRETKSATAREARSKQAHSGSGDMLAASGIEPSLPSPAQPGCVFAAEPAPMTLAARGFSPRAPPVRLSLQDNRSNA